MCGLVRPFSGLCRAKKGLFSEKNKGLHPFQGLASPASNIVDFVVFKQANNFGSGERGSILLSSPSSKPFKEPQGLEFLHFFSPYPHFQAFSGLRKPLKVFEDLGPIEEFP